MDEEAPTRLVEVANLQEHNDIVSTVAASHFHDGLVLSGSCDRRYSPSACALMGTSFCLAAIVCMKRDTVLPVD